MPPVANDWIGAAAKLVAIGVRADVGPAAVEGEQARELVCGGRLATLGEWLELGDARAALLDHDLELVRAKLRDGSAVDRDHVRARAREREQHDDHDHDHRKDLTTSAHRVLLHDEYNARALPS